ncbi:MAG: PDZ domain-containing protein, partial [Chloroflexota bacterium]|nr:PDZ domain-containing protein [Chloroflexota bacterium]
MRLSRADVIALLIALGAAVAGLAVWNHGTVTLGLTLVSDGETVTVHDVTPGSLADRYRFEPGMTILDLETTDGSSVDRGEPITDLEYGVIEELYWPDWEFGLGTVGGPLEPIQTPDEIRLPTEAVEPARIGVAIGGYYSPQDRWLESSASINRTVAESQLRGSIWVSGLTLLFAVVVWRLLAHGVAGSIAREHSVKVAASVAVPGLILPVIQAGTAAGVAAGFLAPAAAALVLGLSLARLHPEKQWVQTAAAGALIAAALAAALVGRYLTSQFLSSEDPWTILLVVGSISALPAAVAASTRDRTTRERASLVSLGLVPLAAGTLVVVVQDPFAGGPVWPSVFVALLLGWHLLPIERAAAIADSGLSRLRSIEPRDVVDTSSGSHRTANVTVAIYEPLVSAAFRDALTLGLFGLVVFFGLFRG